MDLVKELNSKINKNYVDTELRKKAEEAELKNLQKTVNTKANQATVTALETTVKGKADKSELEAKTN